MTPKKKTADDETEHWKETEVQIEVSTDKQLQK